MPDSPATPPRERFTVVVEALPDKVPSRIRLRSFLKRALRSFNIRCVSVTPAEPPAASQAAPAAAEATPESPGDAGRDTEHPGRF
jgi:hypothetical protein